MQTTNAPIDNCFKVGKTVLTKNSPIVDRIEKLRLREQSFCISRKPKRSRTYESLRLMKCNTQSEP